MGAKEFTLNSLVAVSGTIVSAWGGWDIALRCLVMKAVDYGTGFLSVVKNHKVDSEVMFWGGIRKCIILIVLAIAVNLDGMLGNTDPILKIPAIYFYTLERVYPLRRTWGFSVF